MGNNQSSESHPTSPHAELWEDGKKERGSEHRRQHSSPIPHDHGRKSAGSNNAAAVHSRHTPPGLIPVSGAPSTSTSTAQAHATNVSVSPKRTHATSSHTRARSITVGSKLSPTSAPAALASSTSSGSTNMGNTESKAARPPSRSSTLPPEQTSPPDSTPPIESKESPPVAAPSQPVDVPGPTVHEVSAAYNDTPSYGLPPPIYSRPPRLPLPIEEEVHAPGSPILSPENPADEPLDASDLDGGVLPRRTSVTSSAVDDDSSGDEMDEADYGRKVPTKIEWNGRGEKIFVTGTFVNWEKKMKLHRNRDGKPGFSAIIMLPPGTHHLKFLVDDDMTVATDIPTTVDWTNILVNYIEVSALPESAPEPKASTPPAAAPVPIPGAHTSAPSTTLDEAPVTGRDPGSVPDKGALPSSVKADPVDIPSSTPRQSAVVPPSSAPETDAKKAQSPPVKVKVPRPKYTNEIPQFLLDFENLDKHDERHQRASRVIQHLPRPPTLPSTLNKSILNGTTPHKDDASVLLMPNHTVLNHLATSSIKHGVLATSGTTRYRKKFLTTIMYRPTIV